MSARIICIGNALIAADAAGPLVYDILAGHALPAAVELVDGGLAGLRLLPLLEGCDQVVFVDAVAGFREEPGIVVLDPAALPLEPVHYGHQAGLAYLLQAAGHVLDPPLPEIVVVGIEGPATAALCREAASICLATVGAGCGRAACPPSASAQ